MAADATAQSSPPSSKDRRQISEARLGPDSKETAPQRADGVVPVAFTTRAPFRGSPTQRSCPIGRQHRARRPDVCPGSGYRGTLPVFRCGDANSYLGPLPWVRQTHWRGAQGCLVQRICVAPRARNGVP